MSVSKVIDKECGTKVQYIAVRPILWCRWAEFGKEMDTTAYVGKQNYAAQTSASLIAKGGNLVQLKVVVGFIREQCIPLNIREMLRDSGTPSKHDIAKLLGYRENHLNPIDAVTFDSFQSVGHVKSTILTFNASNSTYALVYQCSVETAWNSTPTIVNG